MEIERKWMVSGWPRKNYPLLKEEAMRQGYVTVEPTVRIREEVQEGSAKYILCFKSHGTLSREEIEFPIEKRYFDDIETRIIGIPLIPKVRRTYLLPDGFHLEVNHVDDGLPTEFWYAEIEYPDEETARAWKPQSPYLAQYLADDVTEQPGQSMGAYWVQTRLNGKTNL